MYIEIMEEIQISRAEIQDQIRFIVSQTRDHTAVKIAIQDWLSQKQCPPFETKQILNDLTSYQEYLELLN